MFPLQCGVCQCVNTDNLLAISAAGVAISRPAGMITGVRSGHNNGKVGTNGISALFHVLRHCPSTSVIIRATITQIGTKLKMRFGLNIIAINRTSLSTSKIIRCRITRVENKTILRSKSHRITGEEMEEVRAEVRVAIKAKVATMVMVKIANSQG